MAHVFPRKLNQNSEPIDSEPVNENLRTVVNEVSGRLNEHNLRGDVSDDPLSYTYRFVPEREEVSSDAILNIYRNGWTVQVEQLGNGLGHIEMFGSTDYDTYPSSGPTPHADGAFKISVGGDWVEVDNMGVTIERGGSTIWAMASLQHICNRQYGLLSASAVLSDTNKLNGIQYAIALDGSILHDSILGGADRINDPFGEAWNAFNQGFVTDIIIPVTPGTHRISLYARFTLPHSFETTGWSTGDATSGTNMLICNRELIVVEMR